MVRSIYIDYICKDMCIYRIMIYINAGTIDMSICALWTAFGMAFIT